MSRVESLFKHSILTGPETINAPYTSNSICIDGISSGFAIGLAYDNGVAVNMQLSLEVSLDNENFVPMDSEQVITDASGSHIWDVKETNTSFVRVVIAGAGTIDVKYIIITAKRGH
jgi:hypothetical protein